ncbi:isochorismatase family cysteine hydrolase [Ferrimonas pelagia]|uniref:Isochorismatase-like domain-containing protein n=1 Tax=Ferrimonas pelagia TaxID=1177826 RepID=A0ABP9ELH6_9GAMM
MPALMIVQMQQDFVSPDGSACVAGALPSVSVIATALHHARRQGWLVIHVHRQPPERPTQPKPQSHRPTACIETSWGASPVPELQPKADEMVIHKPRGSAFERTELASHLSDHPNKELVICGTPLPTCLRSTVIDALQRNHPVTLLSDGCSARSDALIDANLQEMAQRGVRCISVNDWLEWLGHDARAEQGKSVH